MKKVILLDPELNWPREQILHALSKQAKRHRLDIVVSPQSSADEQIAFGLAEPTDTLIACGQADWLQTVISLCCDYSDKQQRNLPVFGHITPPRRLPGLHRFGSYLENKLKSELAVIAARKIREIPLYVCNRTIWFTTSLRLERINPESHLAKLHVRTAQGSEVQLQGPLDALQVQTETGTLSRNQPYLLVVGSHQHISSQQTENLLGNLNRSSDSSGMEETFRLPLLKLRIESENRYRATVQAKEVTSPITIGPADTMLRMIVPKNDILQY